MRSKEVEDAIMYIQDHLDFFITEKVNIERDLVETLLAYISELEEIVDVMKPSEIAYRIKLAENYLHKDEIIAIKEECKKEGCCSDELKEYYDNKCVRICKYYEVCKRVDKLLEGE